ncbi:MAG: nucleotidyltransferase family protein, partial [Candidatus Marinimicrobia bacterium]|nr:nucleotidyltransferase family protein [Candidatus Neomarinimicrobiota bacterium]MBT5460144.1 nucleotidyltransferase family protein [Candidatus Neomarinimicrobiota bacterium]
MSNKIAIILCAGYGTRMYPLTKNTPKPLLQVGGRAVLDYLMEELNNLLELQEIFIISNDKFYTHFLEWKSNIKSNNRRIHILNDGSKSNEDRLGAAGDLHFAFQNSVDFSDAIVVGGDNIFLFPLKPIWDQFINQNNHMIMAIHDKNIERLQRTGVLELDASNHVIRLHEKPENPPSQFFSPPLYLLKGSSKNQMADYMNNQHAMDASGHFVDYLCQKETVQAIKSEEGRLDIGNMESYQKANELYNNRSD